MNALEGILVLSVVSVIPGILWVWFFNRQDRQEPEPIPLLAWTFFLGMLSIIPAALLEMPFRTFLVSPQSSLLRFINMVLFVGLVEEASKFVAFFVASYHSKHFNQPIDGIIYSVTAALGFASVENLLYTGAFGLSVAWARSVITFLAHASFSGIVGYYTALEKLKGFHWKYVWRGLGLASLLHGTYNFLIMEELLPPLFVIPMVYLTYRFLVGKINKAKQI
jgi:RsiW-degrading membrane proteinase PrsW (M82 family)